MNANDRVFRSRTPRRGPPGGEELIVAGPRKRTALAPGRAGPTERGPRGDAQPTENLGCRRDDSPRRDASRVRERARRGPRGSRAPFDAMRSGRSLRYDLSGGRTVGAPSRPRRASPRPCTSRRPASASVRRGAAPVTCTPRVPANELHSECAPSPAGRPRGRSRAGRSARMRDHDVRRLDVPMEPPAA